MSDSKELLKLSVKNSIERITSRHSFYASYLPLPFYRLQIAAVIEDADQSVASASKEEINLILFLMTGTVITPKLYSRRHRTY